MNKKEFVYYILNRLNEAGVDICVLSLNSTGEIDLSTDVDIISMNYPIKKVIKLIKEFARNAGWLLVNVFKHSGAGVQLYFYHSDEYISLDIYSKYWCNEKIRINFNRNFKTIKNNNYFIPTNESEFKYLLLKRLSKNSIEQKHYERLFALASNIKINNSDISYYLGEDKSRRIIEYLSNKKKLDPEIINVCFYSMKRKVFEKFTHLVLNIPRIINRILNPTGIFIVFIGPDGSGKSSLVEAFSDRIQVIFRNVYIFHWRPMFLPEMILGRNKFNNTNPHQFKEWTPIFSYIKFIYYLIDFILGYYIKILPAKIKSSAIIFDRYYYDFYFDLKRYRLKLPISLITFFNIIIPKPDLVFSIIADPAIIIRRKNELSLNILQKQNEIITKYFNNNKNSYIVHNDRTLDITLSELKIIILKYLEKKFK
ncbi:MAG: hypothetical protein WHS65_13935 [Melioribacteraceae bacterium]